MGVIASPFLAAARPDSNNYSQGSTSTRFLAYGLRLLVETVNLASWGVAPAGLGLNLIIRTADFRLTGALTRIAEPNRELF
jgi:hypothetical protein